MRKGKMTIAICLIALFLTAWMPGAGYAEEEAGFTLIEKKESASPTQSLEFTLNGSNVKDLYAYEALITFDPNFVELDKAESKLKGFFIPPKATEGKMTIAFTKIGSVKGETGNTALSTITFKVKSQGNANIKLVSVKAVDARLSATVYNYGTGFNDLAGYDWAKKEIEALASVGIIKGTSDTSFSPGANVSRADFVSLLVRALKLDGEADGNFNDVGPSDYFYKEVGIAKKLGIAQGTGDNRFDPKKSISRQDMMVVAARAMKIAGKMLDESDSDLSRFSDASEVAPYAVAPLAQLIKKEIILGDNGKVNPKDTAVRAQAAVIIYRILYK
ncbi:Endo-1,4-beta-xylanase A precursor [compost metagenome]